MFKPRTLAFNYTYESLFHEARAARVSSDEARQIWGAEDHKDELENSTRK
jgi:hypothetical protein